ncbi:coiled-coil domain-containing protein 90B, mitochondrial isoform X2 [Bubalus kerabau]|uniref:coiled-coil domain-containing protein 90B, mitochondrial isoform X2 n=1 Tax=Bubalus carabanensis TaxID=3119969 RepID=UPI00244E5BEE|nr:coiled-coil domain-containing protein 90B, mitochondrial isoform X2 [Bubalus carabanensis]
MERANFARPRADRACAGTLPGDATGRKLHFPASSWRQNYVARKAERDSLRFLTRLPPAGKPVKCGAAGFVRSCVLRFRAPVGVFLRPCEEEITVQQLMAHLDSIRKDMVILEKSEFANLRAENQKMKIELEQVKQQLINETSRIRADNKLDINLERSRVTDMFTDQEKKLMEATTEFTRNDTKTRGIISETGNKIDTEIASLKTLMESNKLETIRYLAASVFTCLAIALGFYRLWK